MKILFTRFPLESAHGGAEVQTMMLMRGLMQRGHAVAFAGSCPVLLDACRKAGIPFVEVHIGPPPVTKFGVISFAWRKMAMRKKLQEMFDGFTEIDVVCMLSLSEKLLLTDYAAGKSARVFWVEHDRVGRWLNANPWLPTLRFQSQKATTVCVSELSRKMYMELGWEAEKTVVIANGVDLDCFKQENHFTLSITHSSLHLGTVARLTRDKGVDVLIDAVMGMPEVSLAIVGRGREEMPLRSQIAHLGLHDRVRIRADEPDLPGFYRSLDIFVLPSRDHDPFGLVAAEAMACGVPTIVTDACGIAAYLRDKHDALIVRAGSSDALCTAMLLLSKEPEMRERLRANGPITARQTFSGEMMVKRYEMLFTGA